MSTSSASRRVNEQSILQHARAIYRSPELVQLRRAYKESAELKLRIGLLYVQFEPQMPAAISAMTDFTGRGFTMGRKAFSTEIELKKTILQEVYRLFASSVGRGEPLDKANARSETDAAFDFAERMASEL